MKALPFLAFAIVLLVTACSKDTEGPTSALRASSILAYDIEGVAAVFDLRAGDGVVLLTYLDNKDIYNFMLLTNAGEILWTRPFKSRQIANNQTRHLHVTTKPDGSFGVICDNGFYNIDLEGNIGTQPETVFPSQTFLQTGTHFRVLDDGSFLVAGQINLGGNRGFIAHYAADGSMMYRRTLLINVGGTTQYTSSAPLPDGGYLFAGSFVSPVVTMNNAYFVSKLTAEGLVEWTKIHDVSPHESVSQGILQSITIPGRNMLPLSDSTFVYLLNPRAEGFSDQRMRLVYFNDKGDEIREHAFIDHAQVNTTNHSLGADRPAMVLNSDASITGLATTAHPIALGNLNLLTPLNYRAPERSFFFDLDANGHLRTTADIDRNYSNSFTSIARLSDGRTMMAGTQLALGLDLKLICIYR